MADVGLPLAVYQQEWQLNLVNWPRRLFVPNHRSIKLIHNLDSCNLISNNIAPLHNKSNRCMSH